MASHEEWEAKIGFVGKSGLAGAAQNVDQLVADQFLDVGAGGLQVLARIEVIGMLVEVLTLSLIHI